VPELPEVETERGRLAARIEGRRISVARIDDPRLTRPEEPEWVAARLSGERVEAVERRGKYLVVRLGENENDSQYESENDSQSQVLLVHLRMTGGFRYAPASHERAVLELDDGTRIAYRDLRRFGTWLLLDPEEAEEHLGIRLGPEPLGRRFTTAYLAGRLARRKAPVKAAILDQRVVAGVGNIYADEALFAAKIHPAAPAGRLSRARIARLHAAVVAALEAGIEAQGASIRDFRTPDGGYGSAQERFLVYGRGGEPCAVCGTVLRRTVIAQRGTVYCPHCQRY